MQVHPILRPYHWENRILLIFSPSEENSSYQKQFNILDNSNAAIKERDLVVFRIFTENGLDPRNNKLSQQEVKALRNLFKVDENYQMLLIGKDGTVKKKYAEAVLMNEINGVIDVMPMRQQEMRRQQ
jgi:hypothetical protein